MAAMRLGKSPKLLDTELIEQGSKEEWENTPGVTYTIHPWAMHSPRFRRAMQLWSLKRRTEKKNAPVDEIGVMQEAQADPWFIAHAVLSDIDGIVDEQSGEPVEYTPEIGAELLSDPKLAHLRDWVFGVAWSLAGRFQEEVKDSGNASRPSSGGKKGGAARSRKTKS